MKVFLDERCLTTYPDLVSLLRSWLQIADFALTCATGLTFFLDRHAIRSGEFLQRFNTLKSDDRTLFSPLLFGSRRLRDWRCNAVANDSICQLDTENDPVTDCAVCEVYEHHKILATIALMGHDHSSFVNRHSVGVAKLEPAEARVEVSCGTNLADFRRIGLAWNCLLVQYDAGLTRPPQDIETVLANNLGRFERTGRIERNGRRHVYREISTSRLFYVDNLHYGVAAHIEVFDSEEHHLGTADLNGNLDISTVVPGRTISW